MRYHNLNTEQHHLNCDNKRITETPCKDACASEKLVHYWLRGGGGGQRTAHGKHSVVRLNGGVDCLVVKIALGGRFFSSVQLSIKKERENTVSGNTCLLVDKSWPIFSYYCNL